MIKDKFSAVGRIEWKVFDRETGKTIRSGKGKNIVVDVGKNALCASMVPGGSAFQLDTMKVGDVNTTFDASSTDLGNTVATTTPTVSSADNVITAEGTFIFDSSYTIEEAGLFDDTAAWAFTNVISETVTPTQGLLIIWTITLT